LSVHKSVLEFFKGVNDFEEVLLLEEERIVFSFTLLDKGFDWDKEGILIEILLEGRGLIVLEFVESSFL
jgi:hypothetical protein